MTTALTPGLLALLDRQLLPPDPLSILRPDPARLGQRRKHGVVHTLTEASADLVDVAAALDDISVDLHELEDPDADQLRSIADRISNLAGDVRTDAGAVDDVVEQLELALR